MKVTTVRYKIAPDRIEENIRLVRAVFSQLHEIAPNGLYYTAMHDGDGSFMHVVRTGDDVPDDVLTSLPAFQEFRSGFKERALDGPGSTEFEVVGNYGIF